MRISQQRRSPCSISGRQGRALVLAAGLAGTLAVAIAAGPVSADLAVALGSSSSFPPLEIDQGSGIGETGGRIGSGFIDERGQEVPGPSRRKTILLSALVPGLGQFIHGEKTIGTLFMIGEVASWTAFTAYRIQGGLREDNFLEVAERFAGVEDVRNQDDAYYGFLARYDRSGLPGGPDSYNEVEVRQEARDLFPGDLERQEEYIRENEITGSAAWDWESDARRSEYESLRVLSESAFHRSEFAIGAMVIGRVLSVMHAIWLTAPDEAAEELSERSYRSFIHTDLASGESRLGVRYSF
jgi:hypothetical protein